MGIENVVYLVLGLYILPMILNILFVYSDSQVKTIGDLMVDNWWTYFVPFLNLFICLMIPFYYIVEFIKNKLKDKWENFKNIKIK